MKYFLQKIYFQHVNLQIFNTFDEIIVYISVVEDYNSYLLQYFSNLPPGCEGSLVFKFELQGFDKI